MRKLVLWIVGLGFGWAIWFAGLISIASSAFGGTCSAPLAAPIGPTVAPHSTYYNDGTPPRRFSRVPKRQLKVRFGQAAIDAFCGRPPCGMVFEACTDGNVIALPDPFTTDPQTFSRIVRHELAHVNGWPDSHGD